jgi:alpha-tubulin suppressor-like RCC1 family protein
VKEINAGPIHAIFTHNDNSYSVCGDNRSGALAINDELAAQPQALTLRRVNVQHHIAKIICKNSFTYLLTNEGDVYKCGRESHAIGAIPYYLHLQKIAGLPKITEIACGNSHVLFLSEDKHVYLLGQNLLPQNANENHVGIQCLSEIDDVIQIAAGYYISYALKKDGTIWWCGENLNGQIGFGNTNRFSATFIQIPNMHHVIEVRAHNNFTTAKKHDGSLYIWGDNRNGQFGLGDSTSPAGPRNHKILNEWRVLQQKLAAYHHESIIENALQERLKPK